MMEKKMEKIKMILRNKICPGKMAPGKNFMEALKCILKIQMPSFPP